jgi:hypothetical protein
MAAAFEVHRSFVLEGRNLFALAGVITDGMVQVGMSANVGENGFAARVHGVEFLEGETVDAATGEPALLFSYSSPDKLRRWQSIDWEGRRLDLTW